MCAVLNIAVFCSFLTTYFPSMLHRYFLIDLEMVLFAHIITGTISVFTFHFR
jgi:hypothetical protein